MRKLKVFWQGVYDVRPGEGARTILMALHMLLVLFAYYILKPVSRALFLNKFDIDRLPLLNVLIAVCGGLLAFFYTRVAVKASLKVAIYWSTGIVLACLLAIWWLLQFEFGWMLYVLNVWVSLFSIVMVSQAWLVAANIFDSREAKRLYGLLGLGAVIGAAAGGEFTAIVARFVETRHLLLASGAMVLLAFATLLAVAAQKNVNLASAKGAEAEEEFAFKDLLAGIRKHRHLQVIMGTITLMFIVDVSIDYQFSALAKVAYPKKEDLTAFLGSFFGVYLTLVTFIMQFFLTAIIVRRLGVEGTLQIMPVVIGATSLVLITMPHLAVASLVRLLEAGTRYTLNKTGMELLYLPLPVDLKNRTKAFVDIFMDRFGRGIGGLVLMAYSALFVAEGKQPDTRQVASLVLGFCLAWIFLSVLASREYVATIRKRLASRRLDLSGVHLAAADAETVQLLKRQLREGTARQAAYALGLLAESAQYEVLPLLPDLAVSAAAEVRRKAFEVAASLGCRDLRAEAEAGLSSTDAEERRAALAYLMAASEESLINADWIVGAAADPDPARRTLAAQAIEIRREDREDKLRGLLDDEHPAVVEASCRAAGVLGGRRYLDGLLERLGEQRYRGVATEALGRFGPRICGALSDILTDPSAPEAIRRRIPRVLRLIPDQRSVDVLLGALAAADEILELAILKALNRLRESSPELAFSKSIVGAHVKTLVRNYFALGVQVSPLRAHAKPRTAAGLLVKSIDVRLAEIEDRLFRLMALCYPPKEIYSSFLAVRSGQPEKVTVALDYLDSILARDWKQQILPVLEGPARLAKNAGDLLGIPTPTMEAALLALIGSGSEWRAGCAMAAAAELGIRSARQPIQQYAESGTNREYGAVARAAVAALA